MALAAAILMTAAPALADGPGPVVEATADNTFFPKALTISPGTTVYWENRGIQHNVKFDDGSFEQPADPESTPWRVWRRFDTPGTYRYYCEFHGGPNGQGMAGVITVDAQADPRLTGLKVSPRRVCNRRTRRCRKTAAVVTFTLSEPARVSGGVDPVGGRAGRRGLDLQLDGKQGANSLRVSGRRLDPGLYKVTLSAEDTDGNESPPSTAYFRVKRARR